MRQDVWEKACKAWDDIVKIIGFEKREDAYRQGFYAGYCECLEDWQLLDEEEE